MQTKITAAMALIKQNGLDRLRCNLTGAPYATLDDAEIVMALESDLRAKPSMSVDNLYDSWELRALAFNSSRLPVLRNANDKALLAVITGGANGQARVFTYMLTRLFFPHIGSEQYDSLKAVERMHFSRQLHDKALTIPMDQLAALVQKLAAIDAYCAIPFWHKMWAFESQFSKHGIDKAPSIVRKAFANPEIVFDSAKAIPDVIQFLLDMMLFVVDRQGVSQVGGNRLAQQIMLVNAPVIQVNQIPHFQKVVTQEQLDTIARQRIMNNSKAVRLAHSAIHGKGHKPGESSMEAMAAKMAKQMAKDLRATPNPKATKPKAAKEPTDLQKKMSAAFAALMIKL